MTTELEELRARVDQLERELAERTAKAEAAVAAAQERSYWRTALPLRPEPRDADAHRASRATVILLGTVRTLQALKRRLS